MIWTSIIVILLACIFALLILVNSLINKLNLATKLCEAIDQYQQLNCRWNVVYDALEEWKKTVSSSNN